jgi:hypothetical protein
VIFRGTTLIAVLAGLSGSCNGHTRLRLLISPEKPSRLWITGEFDLCAPMHISGIAPFLPDLYGTIYYSCLWLSVDPARFELATFSMPLRRAPNCAMGPDLLVCLLFCTAVDLEGFEPSTSSVRLKRAPNCATGPFFEGEEILPVTGAVVKQLVGENEHV